MMHADEPVLADSPGPNKEYNSLAEIQRNCNEITDVMVNLIHLELVLPGHAGIYKLEPVPHPGPDFYIWTVPDRSAYVVQDYGLLPSEGRIRVYQLRR